MRNLIIALALFSTATLAHAAELSAEQVGRQLGVPIAKVTSEKSRANAQSNDTTYLSAKGEPVVLIHRGPASLWAGTRDAVAGMSEPFPGVAQAYRVKDLNMVCAPGAGTFVCVTPSLHYPLSGTKPTDESLRALLKASL